MKAMILAAGLGTRLGDLTLDVPKGMLGVEGRPLLEYIVANLARHGFDELMINLHHRAEVIRDYFGDGRRWNVRIAWSHEASLLGTAGGVKNVESFFGGEDFVIHYGDVVTDENLTAMLDFHRGHAGAATLLVHQRPGSNSVVVVDDDRRITRFLERPDAAARDGIASPWVHSGVAIARRELLELIPAGRAADLPRDVYVPAIARGRAFFAWPLTGYRCAVDSPARLEALRAAVREGRVSL